MRLTFEQIGTDCASAYRRRSRDRQESHASSRARLWIWIGRVLPAVNGWRLFGDMDCIWPQPTGVCRSIFEEHTCMMSIESAYTGM